MLQGEQGSGHQFIDDAESLLFLAISYFHPEEVAYDRLLAKVEALDGRHQLRLAHACERRYAEGSLHRPEVVEAIPWAERDLDWLASSLGYLRTVVHGLARLDG